MATDRHVDSISPEETAALAARIAAWLRAGDTLCLRGDLGAGKTTFTRALVAALGSAAPVSSPTFTLIHEYPGGRLPVYHADAYRLRGPRDVPDTGLEEYMGRGDGVTVIEWPERIEEALPADRLDITLEDTGEESRRITLTPRGDDWKARLAKEEPTC